MDVATLIDRSLLLQVVTWATGPVTSPALVVIFGPFLYKCQVCCVVTEAMEPEEQNKEAGLLVFNASFIYLHYK